MKMWKIYNDKIEVISFVMMSGKELDIGIKFEGNVKK